MHRIMIARARARGATRLALRERDRDDSRAPVILRCAEIACISLTVVSAATLAGARSAALARRLGTIIDIFGGVFHLARAPPRFAQAVRRTGREMRGPIKP